MRISNRLLPVIMFLISWLAVSCYTEMSLGKRFVKSVATGAPPVWFIGADYLFFECLIPADSAGKACIMRDTISDSNLLEAYNRSFALRLASFGYNVFTYAEADSFLAHPGGGVIVHIAQLEFEEDGDLYIESEVFGDYEYIESFPVRVIRLHSWVEVTGNDTVPPERKVYYASGSASDLIEGVFTRRPFSGEISYSYTRYDMRPSLTPVFFSRLGEEHAQRLFDTWLNDHIRSRIRNASKPGIYLSEQGYYTLDPTIRRVRQTDPSHKLQELQ
jgi:hypothetical protein